MANFGDGGELLKCSFCGKSQKQVKKLIAGPGVYICDECIDLCNEIIEEELSETSELQFDELPKPREIFEFLNDFIVGQDLATVDRLSATFHELMNSRGAGLDDEDAEDLLGDAVAFTGSSKFPARIKCALLGWAALSDALILSGAREA